MTHIRNSYEAEDISTYDRARTIGSSTGSLCGIGGASSSSVPTGSSRFYSPPGTSYTIVERSHSPHSYYNSAGDCQTVGTSKSRGLYLESLTQNGQKTRPISPERMFPATLSSTPSSYHHLHTNGRNSPPLASSSYQIYHRSGRGDRSMVTRTVTMCRDQQPDGTHGFGICVKGGRETGSLTLLVFFSEAFITCGIILIGIGVYISRIEESSVAERSGLRPGDTILEVNGTPFSGMTHDEALAVNEMSFASVKIVHVE